MSITNDSDDESDNGSSSGTFQSFADHYSEESLAIILIVIGAILFFTVPLFGTVVGIISIILGIITWFTDWLWG